MLRTVVDIKRDDLISWNVRDIGRVADDNGRCRSHGEFAGGIEHWQHVRKMTGVVLRQSNACGVWVGATKQSNSTQARRMQGLQPSE